MTTFNTSLDVLERYIILIDDKLIRDFSLEIQLAYYGMLVAYDGMYKEMIEAGGRSLLHTF